jgi:hypothetical protein
VVGSILIPKLVRNISSIHVVVVVINEIEAQVAYCTDLPAKLPNTDSRVGSSHSLALAISDGEYLNSLPRGKFFQQGFQVSQKILGSHK